MLAINLTKTINSDNILSTYTNHALLYYELRTRI